MAKVTVGKKACAVNPLKMSQPIGGAFAFMGLRGSMPLLHGSQGCTSFGLTRSFDISRKPCRCRPRR